VVVNVSVGDGTDTERAHAPLFQLAARHPNILGDPAPVASFEQFGERSANLMSRCHMPTPDARVEVITQLHTAIDKALWAAGGQSPFLSAVFTATRAPLSVRLPRAGKDASLSPGGVLAIGP
jgi:potassium efflux system protein